jgi:hypothetical protein
MSSPSKDVLQFAGLSQNRATACHVQTPLTSLLYAHANNASMGRKDPSTVQQIRVPQIYQDVRPLASFNAKPHK